MVTSIQKGAWCLLLVLGTVAGLPQTKEPSVASVVKQSSEAVVQIVVSDSAGKEIGLGSGF